MIYNSSFLISSRPFTVFVTSCDCNFLTKCLVVCVVYLIVAKEACLSCIWSSMSCSICWGSKGTLSLTTQGEWASIGANAHVDLLRCSSCTDPVLYGLMLTKPIKMCDFILHCCILMNILTVLVSGRELTTVIRMWLKIISERNCVIRVDSVDSYKRKLGTSFTVLDEINFPVFAIFQDLSIWKLQ